MAAIVAALTHLWGYYLAPMNIKATGACSPPEINAPTPSRGLKRQAEDDFECQSHKKFKASHHVDLLVVLPSPSPKRSLGRTTSPLSPHPVPFQRKSLPRSRSSRKPLSLHRQALLRWHDIGLRKRLPPRQARVVKPAPLPLMKTYEFRQSSGTPTTSVSNITKYRSSSRSMEPISRHQSSYSRTKSADERLLLSPSLDVEMFCEEDDFDEFDDDEEDEDIDSDSDDEEEGIKKEYGQQIHLDTSYTKPSSAHHRHHDNLPIPPIPELTPHVDTNSDDMDEDDDSSDSDEDDLLDWDVIIPSESDVTAKLGLGGLEPASKSLPVYDRVRLNGRFDEFV